MKKTQIEINRIKNYIIENPKYALVKNKHSLNLIIMKNYFPQLERLEDGEVDLIFKKLLNLDRLVRKAKEELKIENKIKLSEKEEMLLEALQKNTQKKLGY